MPHLAYKGAREGGRPATIENVLLQLLANGSPYLPRELHSKGSLNLLYVSRTCSCGMWACAIRTKGEYE